MLKKRCPSLPAPWKWICLSMALSLIAGRSAFAAEWQLFGVESFSGYLALRGETYSEQSGDASTDRHSVEQLARLQLASYLLHPRFLAITTDTSFAYRAGTGIASGLENRDTGVAVDFLRENLLTFGAAARSRVEQLEKDFKDYERQTDGVSARLALRGARLSASLKYEDAQARCEEYFPENRRNRLLLFESSLRRTASDALSLRYRAVDSDDRLATNQDSRYQAADLDGSQRLAKDRGTLNYGMSAWQAELPISERRLTVRQSWLMNWTPSFKSSEELEIGRRENAGADATSYRLGLGANRSLGSGWELGGTFGGTRNVASTGEENTLYRVANTISYAGQRGPYRLGFNNTLGLVRIFSGPERSIPASERLRLPFDGRRVQLAYPNVQAETVVVKDPDDPTKFWKRGVDWELYQVGAYTFVSWIGDKPDDHVGEDYLTVIVEYGYELPTTDYAELGDTLTLRGTRESSPGVGLDSNVTLTATVPGTKGPGLAGLDFAQTRYEAGLQGYLKRPEYEAAAGGTVGSDRQTLFARGSLNRGGWQWSESYRAEFFPSYTGHRLDSRLGRLWGITEKTSLDLELTDQTYFVDGRLNQALTSAKARTVWLFNPFMRVELEGRGEVNRTLPDAQNVALDAKYLWQQGQLDLSAGYEIKVRTYDRFTSHRVYLTVLRRL